MASSLSQRFAVGLEYKQLSNKLRELKAFWRSWLFHLKHTSGWASIRGIEAPHSDDDTENAHFVANPACEPFRKTLPPNWELFEDLFGEDMSTGDEAEGMEEAAGDSPLPQELDNEIMEDSEVDDVVSAGEDNASTP